MTVAEVFEQVKSLSQGERIELLKLLVNTLDEEVIVQGKTGAEIVAMLQALDEPIEFVDSHIDDPVAWVKTQRQKRQEKLSLYRDGESE